MYALLQLLTVIDNIIFLLWETEKTTVAMEKIEKYGVEFPTNLI